LPAHPSLLSPLRSLLTPPSSLLPSLSSLLTSHSSLLTPHSSLLTPHFSLLTPHSSLLTTHSSFLVPFQLSPRTSLSILPSLQYFLTFPSSLLFSLSAHSTSTFNASLPSAVPFPPLIMR